MTGRNFARQIGAQPYRILGYSMEDGGLVLRIENRWRRFPRVDVT